MVKKIIAFIALIMIAVNTRALAAGDLYSVNTRQIYCYKDMMRVYADMEDKDNNPVELPNVTAVLAYIDGNKLTAKKTIRFADTEEGEGDIFLVDSSGSMRDNQMNDVKAAIKSWADNMKENDRMAIIAFGDDTEVKIDYSNDKAAISSAVDSIENKGKRTKLYGGIMKALEMTDRNDVDLPKRKNIILITDGVNDYSGGISEGDIYAELRKRLIPVYSMWMSNSKENNNKGRATLNSVAEYSGGEIYDMSDKGIDSVYAEIRSSILNSCVLDFTYDGANPDNNQHVFNLKVSQNGRQAEDTVDFTMKKNDESSGSYTIDRSKQKESGKEEKKLPWQILFIIGGGAILLAAGAIILSILLKRRSENNIDYDYDSNYDYNEPTPAMNDNMASAANPVGQQLQTRPVTMTSMSSKMTYTIQMSDAMAIGRSADNTFTIDDPTVSGHHAMIIKSDNRMYIEDLSSKNGTLLNGCVVEGQREVESGDVLSFGRAEFKIQF